MNLAAADKNKVHPETDINIILGPLLVIILCS